MARKVTIFYRRQGYYPFAAAYLPAQKLAQGVLNITVLEGRYGQVKAKESLIYSRFLWCMDTPPKSIAISY